MTEKDHFLKVREQEFKTTVRVLSNFPSDHLDFRPHERSQPAEKLLFVFAIEEDLMQKICRGQVDFNADFNPYANMPDNLDGIIQAYKKSYEETSKLLEGLQESSFEEVIQFGPWPQRRGDALWGMLFDGIHHRGQLTVYLRLAGGMVPSIYGPSADESMEQAAEAIRH